MAADRKRERTRPAIFRRAMDQLGAATAREGLAGSARLRGGDRVLDAPFALAEAASAALGAGASIARDLGRRRGQPAGDVAVASRHAEVSLLSFMHLRFADPERAPAARTAPEARTAAAGFFRTKDGGHFYLHPGFPHNTRGLLELLGTRDDRPAVTRAVARWHGSDLEAAVAERGLCGAQVRSPAAWDASTQGRALAARPVVEIVQIGESPPEPPPEGGERPLEGTRVLDLTRILAGPTCARTLASYGARVLRVGAPTLPSIPLFVADTGFGKRSCHLDLRTPGDARRLRGLLRDADVFSQGYRTGAMSRLGFDAAEVAALRPGIIYVSINCYGHEGDWRARPGWEQLAQTVTGMADLQGRHARAPGPTLLPAAANDYTTGYLAALGTLAALEQRARVGGSYWVRVSLARTAMWIRGLGAIRRPALRPMADAEVARYSGAMTTPWGDVRHLAPAVSIEGSEVGWRQPPVPLGSSRASWGR